MKINAEQGDTGFKPITVTMVIESREELNNIKNLTNTNQSVPRVVKENCGDSDESVIKMFLQTLKDEIYHYF